MSRETRETPLSLRGAKVLLTGGGGFLGRTLAGVLGEQGAEVVAPGREEVDLGDTSAVLRFFTRTRPDCVVHAAAVGGGIGWMSSHPATAFTGNILMNTVVLDAAFRVGARRFVGVSSACAYAREASQPMREEALFEGQPEPSNGPYGLAKRMMLVQGAAYQAEHGFDCAFAVPTNLYGPGDHFEPERSHIVAALLRRFWEAKENGDPDVVCWGTGTATRDLLHVRDAALGIRRLLEVGGGPAPVNLGSGQELTTRTIAETIAAIVGYDGVIRWDATKPDGMPRKVLDTGRAWDRLGWRPEVALADGLRESLEWFVRSR